MKLVDRRLSAAQALLTGLIVATLFSGCAARPLPVTPTAAVPPANAIPSPTAPITAPTDAIPAAPTAAPTWIPTFIPSERRGIAGAAGIGDPYYPTLGNGGYDVTHYDIALDIDPATNSVTAATTVQAVATETLASFDLDFGQMTIDQVSVSGVAATYTSRDNELKITPSASLEAGKPFVTVVRYHGQPSLKADAATEPVSNLAGWSHNTTGAINVINEPAGAREWFPSNDHPDDKATFRFDVTVPKPWMVAASGELKEQQDQGDKTRYVFEMDAPMATYLASVNVDQYGVEKQAGPDGVSIRNYFPADYPERARVRFRRLPEMITYLSQLFGPYPFKEYGVLIAAADQAICKYAGADEVQTMSIHCPGFDMADEQVIVHELAHQWFGDSVSLARWQDVWLKEGMATYVEWLWVTRATGASRIDNVVKVKASQYHPIVPVADPSGPKLYREEVYLGGALVFHALRKTVGDETFFKILRTYLERYHYGNASTQDFMSLAQEVSGRDLKSLFDEWLYKVGAPKFDF